MAGGARLPQDRSGMTEPYPTDPPRARVPLMGIVATLVGTALFVFSVRQAGLGQIVDNVQRLGWAFLGIVVVAGLRFAARGMAWRSCLEGSHGLRPWLAFRAVVAGDTLGNLTPLSILVSEPAKALFASDQEPLSRTLPALAVENLFYSLSAAVVIAGGAAALLPSLRSTETWGLAGVALVTTLIVLISVAHTVIWKRVRVATACVGLVQRRWGSWDRLARWAERAQLMEERVHALYPREPGRLARLAGWELTFHALAMVEVYMVLSLISTGAPTVVEVFLFESGNRFINVVFKVVPLRLGVDEAGTAVVAELLGFGSAAGVTLAIVRKARQLVWMGVGGLFLLGRGLSVDRVLADRNVRGRDDQPHA